MSSFSFKPGHCEAKSNFIRDRLVYCTTATHVSLYVLKEVTEYGVLIKCILRMFILVKLGRILLRLTVVVPCWSCSDRRFVVKSSSE